MSYYYPLFEHLSRAHNLTLLDSEMEDIIRIVHDLQWQSPDSMPDHGHFVAVDEKGNQHDCHFAENLSGEEQPAFSGFFRPVLSEDKTRIIRYDGIKPVKWRLYHDGELRLDGVPPDSSTPYRPS